MNGNKSKFNYSSFTDGYFAVNKDKYTQDQAIAIFQEETGENPKEILTGTVLFGMGIDDNGDKHNTWWLNIYYKQNTKRRCPVWVMR